MEAGGAAAKPQLRCYGRRNRSKSAKEEVSSPGADDARSNGKLPGDKRLVEDSVGQERAPGDSKLDLASEESKLNAGKGAVTPSKLEPLQSDAGKTQELCVVATEAKVLDETPQKDSVRFLNEEEELAYEDSVLSRAEEIWTRQEALEQVKRRAPSKWKEPTHAKSHWDYVLEEMVWLSKDFDKERKWKVAQAKRVAMKVAKAKSEEESKGMRRLKGEEQRIRRIASNIAKEVKKFWVKIEKLVVYKHQLAVEQKKKKALDKHLNFLLGQTERYSSMLAVNLSGLPENNEDQKTQDTGDLLDAANEPSTDKDFTCDQMEEEDDEATLEADEALITEDERKEELNALQRESELPIEELVGLYAKGDNSEEERSTSDADQDKELDDEEYDPHTAYASEEDDERTFDEEEKLAMAENKDVNLELEQLKMENELPVSELLSRYRAERAESSGDEKGGASDAPSDSSDEAKERMGEPSTSGRSSLLIIKSTGRSKATGDSKIFYGTEQEAEVLANVARAAQQRGERMRKRAGLDDSSRVEGSGKTGRKELDDAAAAALSAQPTGYTFSTTRVRTKIPFLLKHSLREYQHIGLDWLVTMYEKRLNGILADEMGLGKTIMTIALLAHLACEKGIWGPHLIVVPTSVMLNWETEFMKWCPAFKVLTYFGNAKERKIKRQGWSKANSFHVCITTYRLVIQDAKAFKRKKWKYLILDEAHLIKNWKSQRWQMLLNFNSKRRILLTGTPLQNDLMELWSLMHFLMPHVFQSHQEFRDWFSNPISGMVEGQDKVNQDVVDRLHNVLRPFILRRLKRDVEKQLPGKHEHVVPCRLSKRQRNLYEDFMASSDTQATLSGGNFLGLINVLMQLRKVCNHPDLFESRPIVSSFDMPGLELQMCSELCTAVQQKPFSTVNLEVLNYLLSEDMEAWEPSELAELATPTPLIEEIATSGEDSWNEQEQVTEPQNIFEEIQAALAAQRLKRRREKARQFGWLNILRCSRHVVYGRGLAKHVEVEHPVYGIHAIQSDPSRYLTFPSAIAEVVRLPSSWCESLLDLLQAFVFVIPAARAPPPLIWCSRQSASSILRHDFPSNQLAEMSDLVAPLRPVVVRQQLFFPDRRLLQFDCGKLQQLSVLLRRLKSEGHRALIFTQMTKMLDILESFINLYGYNYMRLDGSTKPEQRQILMQRFNTNPKIFLFILSTRSGGVGINLVGADTVIFYDSDWNPAMDQQAQDRCHRIGQTREVHIYRLVSESTIEENILKKANQKRFLDNLVIQSGGYNTEFFKKLDPMELLSGVNTTKRADQPLSNADVDAALKSAEDEADYMAMKKVELEEAAENQEFAEDVSVEEDECADDLEDGKVSETKVPSPEIETAGTPSLPELKEPQPLLLDAEEEVDMLADVKQLAAAAAASGHGNNFEDQLKPIERYAIQFLDLWNPIIDTSALETQVTYEEKEWELEQIEKLKEEQEADIDEDDEPLLYESWDTSNADAAYRQQVEVLTQQQELLQAQWDAMHDEELQEADRLIEGEKQLKRPKKKKLKSLERSSVEEYNFCSEEDAGADDHIDADEADEVLSIASDEGEYDMQWDNSLRTPFQRKRKFSRFLEEEGGENKRFRKEDSRTEYFRPRFGGKLTICTTARKSPVILLERDRRKEALKAKDHHTDWMPEEDEVLCAVVHEYGGNWLLASDALEGMPDGGVYRGRHRHPVKCKDRFRQLVVENAGTICGGMSSERLLSGAVIKVTEEDTKRLLELVQRVPDKEVLLQRHFATVQSVKDSYKGSAKSRNGFVSNVGHPRNLPFVSLANLCQGCLKPPLRQASHKQGHALVAEALSQTTASDNGKMPDACKAVKNNTASDNDNEDVESQPPLELSLSFSGPEEMEDFRPVNVTLRPGKPKTAEPPSSSSIRSLVCETRFRLASQMTPSIWAAAAISVVPKATPSQNNPPVKRQQPPTDVAKLQRPGKQPRLQPVSKPNGMIEIRPVEMKTSVSPSQIKPANLKKPPPTAVFTTTGASRVHHVATKPSSSSSIQLARPSSSAKSTAVAAAAAGSTAPAAAGGANYPFAQYWRPDSTVSSSRLAQAPASEEASYHRKPAAAAKNKGVSE
ncbi:protein PHOTOPERIOD-INDEPENDENT EARLY FLOWERING 1 [Selaginella moellendorffii]|uniref:protein PHOTOPERIOD-INDEPENDENT EARLY FLOWERING 1 n=1 Tax=Selaginella moellendorffii TaxID=88036 RepID=UPI000D1D05B3|nr:protein PHOTOPERIOD-INDEPENDENT EARLY FLOWERING 1 [Selaginella moellendorffii]|eukprot:XP_024535951.1 protein PHOTOPERIOD-INDEPENDENT EARLY FLOWERING 1 [Selaginella moellendorffii]